MVVVLGLLLVFAATVNVMAATPGDYQSALQRADQLESQGRFSECIAVLEALAADFEQDPVVRLQLGWLYYRQGHYQAAARWYQAVLDLSPTSDDAGAGLAWSLYHLGRPREARSLFLDVLARTPDYPQARSGEELTRLSHRFGAGMAGLVHLYEGHATKQSAAGLALYGHFLWWDSLAFGGSYRYTKFAARTTSDDVSYDIDFAQHEGNVYLGATTPRFGGSVHYGYADGGGASNYSAHYAGGVARLSARGDWRLEASGSWFETESVYRVALDYTLSLAPWFALVPALAYQSADGDHLGNGSLSAVARYENWQGTLSGKYGLERRPLYLASGVIYNSDDDIAWGLSASLSYRFTTGLGLAAGYELQALEQSRTEAPVASNLYLFYLSLGWDSSWTMTP